MASYTNSEGLPEPTHAHTEDQSLTPTDLRDTVQQPPQPQTAHRDNPQRELSSRLQSGQARTSSAGHDTREGVPVSAEGRASLEDQNRASIMNDEMFGERYNYSMAEGAAGNPLRFLSAMGRDVGGLLMSGLGFNKKAEQNPEKCSQSSDSAQKEHLKRQAAEIKRKGKKRAAETPRDAAVVETQQAVPLGKVLERDESHADIGEAEDGLETLEPEIPDFVKDSTSSMPSGDSAAQGTGQAHYDPKNDVILRLETMSAAETRFLVALLWVWLLTAFAFLIYDFYVKLQNGDSAVESYHYAVINAVMGTISLAVIGLVCVTHTMRIIYNLRQKKVWKSRKTKSVIYTSVELFVQFCNLLFFVLPNYEEFGPRCFRFISPDKAAYYSLARWTCWNTFFLISLIYAHNANIISVEKQGDSAKSFASIGSGDGKQKDGHQVHYKDMIVHDLPFFKAHWWKLILWLMMEAFVITGCVYYAENSVVDKSAIYHPVRQACGEVAEFACRVSNTQMVLVSIMLFWPLVYFALYCYFIAKAFEKLKQKSNTDFRIANQIVRLQVRLRLPAFTLFIFSLILLWFVRPFKCTSLYLTWWGMLPGQLAATGCVLLTMFVQTPKMIARKERPPVLQVWLQEFCWLEAEKPARLARRNETMAPEERHLIEREPMFCVETMMKALYWSLLVYDFEEVQDSRLSLAEGCALFKPPLDQYELFWEKSLDTKMLLAWSRKRIVLAFRGTASLANVMADVQAWRTNHYPTRGSWWSRPKVHSGFDKAWRNNGLNERVLAKIEELFQTNQVDKDDIKFMVTGHSLGGSLACQSAFDVRRLGKKKGADAKVTCITFGAPRVGNRAFSKEFEAMVPDCWHIINDQDVVARGGKFLFLYKRGGHRVLINALGDLIVRPGPLETSMRLVPCTGSIQQHLLTSYLQSLLTVLLAQFSNKRLSGGMAGVIALVQHSVPIKRILLQEAGLEIKDLIDISRWGKYATKVKDVAKLPITGRKSGAVAKDMKSRSTDDSKASTTRGGFFCNCCAPSMLRVVGEEPEPAADNTEEDNTNIRDGGGTTDKGQVSPELDKM